MVERLVKMVEECRSCVRMEENSDLAESCVKQCVCSYINIGIVSTWCYGN